MGLTNFHSPRQILARASESKSECQAIIQDFGHPVYVNYTSFDQETINEYQWRLQYGHLDQWASLTAHLITITKTPDPLKIPKLCISPSFQPSFLPKEMSSKVDYVFLVEGNRGANMKLVLKRNIHDAGVALFHEAMNGFSVPFSGVISKNVSQQLIDTDGSWMLVSRKVDSVEELFDIEKEDMEILIL